MSLPGVGRWLGRVSRRDPLGPKGERIAAKYLRRKGFRVLTRNLRTSVGEIDLLCLAPDRQWLVIVEVKARRIDGDAPSGRAVPPEVSITAHKRKKLHQLAKSVSNWKRFAGRPLRIDVVAVEVPRKGKPIIRHYERAV